MAQKTPLYPASTLAKLFDLSERRIRQLAQQSIIPSKEDGKYDLVKTVQGYMRYLQAQAAGQGITTDAIHAQKLRRIKAMADEKELNVQLQSGQIVPTQTVIELGGRKVIATKTGLLAMADRVSQMLGLSQVKRNTINVQIKQVLLELADYTENEKPIPLTTENIEPRKQIG